MYDAELGSHPATSDSPQRRGNEQLRYAVDSTIEEMETQVVSAALVEVQEEVGEYQERCRKGIWTFDLVRGRTIRFSCKSKACAICRRRKATKYAGEIESEELTHYEVVPRNRWGAYRKMMSRKGFPCKRLPVKDSIIAISNMGSEALPDDVVEFLDDLIFRTQGMGRIRGFKKEPRGNKSDQYWRPSGWSLGNVVADVSVALRDETWKLVPYSNNTGFRLIGRWRDNVRVFEMAGIVGSNKEVVW